MTGGRSPEGGQGAQPPRGPGGEAPGEKHPSPLHPPPEGFGKGRGGGTPAAGTPTCTKPPLSAPPTTLSTVPTPLSHPDQLKELLGIPFTPEQTACITAPPAPQVIVAGAGSGKTTVMAARVVWLVGTGQVAPEQVLGLTFTNKAAGELAERVRTALTRAGITDPDALEPERGEPGISTYHAFAGRLLTDHGLRMGLEPTSRLLADATRFQLAARVLREAPGPYPALTKSFATLVSDLLALDAELAEHLVRPGAPGRVRPGSAAHPRGRQAQQRRAAQGAGGGHRPPRTARPRRALPGRQEEPGPAGLRRPDRRCPPSSPSPTPRSAGCCARSSRWCFWTSTRTPRSPSAGCSPRSSAAAPATP